MDIFVIVLSVAFAVVFLFDYFEVIRVLHRSEKLGKPSKIKCYVLTTAVLAFVLIFFADFSFGIVRMSETVRTMLAFGVGMLIAEVENRLHK